MSDERREREARERLSHDEALRAALEGADTSYLDPRAFAQALERAESEAALRVKDLRALSGGLDDEIALWAERWPLIDETRRREIAKRLVEHAEADVSADFGRLYRLLLDDPDAEVRAAAVEGLWESEDFGLIPRFIAILNADPVDAVRASAAYVLGRFVERGELGSELQRRRVAPAVERLVEIAEDEREDPETRRRALAAAGYADRQDVRNAIDAALRSEDRVVLAGAIRAMGNSADASWEEVVLDWLTDDDPELRFEATRAAGELELLRAVTPLASSAQFETDPQVRSEAIWALGEIGGAQAKRALERIADSLGAHEEALAEAVDEALASCALIEGDLGIAPFDFGGEEAMDDEDAEDDEDEDGAWDHEGPTRLDDWLGEDG